MYLLRYKKTNKKINEEKSADIGNCFQLV